MRNQQKQRRDRTRPGFARFDELPVAVFCCKRDGTLRYYNRAAASLWGDKPTVGRRGWSQAYQTYDKKGRPVFFEQIGQQDTPYGAKPFVILIPEGKTRIIAAYHKGKLTALTDISEIAGDENGELITSAMIEYSDDSIITTLLDGVIINWNPAATALFGYSDQEAIGRHINLLIPEERLEEEQLIIQRIRDGGKVSHYETIRISREGRAIPVSLTVSALKDPSGEIIGIIKVARDISVQLEDRQQLKDYSLHLEEVVRARTRSLEDTVADLKQAKAQLTASLEKEKELNQLKSRFVSMASHEFRTPLSAVQLSAALIEKYLAKALYAGAGTHLQKIKNAVTTLNGILNDFLSLEKLEGGKVSTAFSDVDLQEFAVAVTEEMQLLVRPGQQICYAHGGSTARVVLDPSLLHNCLINLLSNAIKYSPEGARIDLFTTITDGGCKITVKDEGIGIPEEEQHQLFEAFFRANNTTGIQGTGLGLNIVSRYVSLMNGHIGFESLPGKGTKFTLSFPLHPREVNTGPDH